MVMVGVGVDAVGRAVASKINRVSGCGARATGPAITRAGEIAGGKVCRGLAEGGGGYYHLD